jgi:L-lactate dehydrogenase complex protein LldG
VDEQAFLNRVKTAVARTVPDFGKHMNDHVREMRQHGDLNIGGVGGPGGPVAAASQPAPRPALLGEMAGLPAAGAQMELAAHWVAEFARVGGRGRIAANAAEAIASVTEMVAAILQERGGYAIVTAHPALEGIAPALAAAGLPVELYREAGDRQRLAGATVGVTVASAAIAESGSLVIESHTHQGRYSSLLPPVHLAVVPPGALAPSVVGWLATRGERFQAGEDLPSSTAFATGPSRSADIAGDLALGVHGPGEAHAVVVLA